MTTGQRLKMLREQRGQSQADIAKLLGVGRTTYLKYESGENRPTRKLKELSALFNVTSDYIMCLSDDPHGTMVPKGKGLYQHLMESGLSPKEEREIESDLEDMMNSIASAAYEADDAEKEDIEALKAALHLAMMQAKRIAKKKYTPKKYRKD
jgi:transcriptional regulator with XRE-family HTH domain